MVKNIIKLILVVVGLVVIYNVYNIVFEKFEPLVYTFEVENNLSTNANILEAGADGSVLIDENNKNYVKLNAGLYNSYKLGIARKFHQMKNSKGVNNTYGDANKSVIISVTPTDNSEKTNSEKTSMMKMMTFSLQTNLTP